MKSALQFSSSKSTVIQLLLIAPLSLSSLCWRFDLYFVKIVVKSKTVLKRNRCSACPRTLRHVFVCLWEGDNQKGRLKNQAYLISWASDTAEWDRKVSAVQGLQLQIVALSSATVYLLDLGGGGQRNDKANDYLSERSARRLESCFGVACTERVAEG